MGAFDYGGSSASTSSGRWITNPKQLSAFINPESRITYKNSPTSSVQLNTAVTSLGYRGATASISGAATYVTVCNLTGAGFLFNCISPTYSGPFTPTILITVDGTSYTIAPSAATAAQNRLILGPITPYETHASASAAATTGDIIMPNSANDGGFKNALVGGVATGDSAVSVSIPTPEMALSYNMQCLRFEKSLRVEMMCDLYSAVANDRKCAATYRLDL